MVGLFFMRLFGARTLSKFSSELCLLFYFCVSAFIADETLGCRLAQCYKVFTPLFASAKGAKVLMAKNVFIRSFSRACLGAIASWSSKTLPAGQP
jgi:hypothetical protein